MKIEQTEINGWDAALYQMQEASPDWRTSDSGIQNNIYLHNYRQYIVGPQDLFQMKKMLNNNINNRNFLRLVMVTADITAPLYWFEELFTYTTEGICIGPKVIDVILKTGVGFDDFDCDDLYPDSAEGLTKIIQLINEYQQVYHITKSPREREQIVQLLPHSYMVRRTIRLNYKDIYDIVERQSLKRTYDKEWDIFIQWADSLPNFTSLYNRG